jgi:hypothetical protein
LAEDEDDVEGVVGLAVADISVTGTCTEAAARVGAVAAAAGEGEGKRKAEAPCICCPASITHTHTHTQRVVVYDADVLAACRRECVWEDVWVWEGERVDVSMVWVGVCVFER